VEATLIPKRSVRVWKCGVLALIVSQGTFTAARTGPSANARTKTASSQATTATAQDGKKTVWDGIYTVEQAKRGEQAFARACSYCHGSELDGGDDPNGPALRGPFFFRQWHDLTVAELFTFISQQMPQSDPGSLTPQTYIDIISFVFQANKMPAGDTELPPVRETLEHVLITQTPPKS
jgi:cytochrome c